MNSELVILLYSSFEPRRDARYNMVLSNLEYDMLVPYKIAKDKSELVRSTPIKFDPVKLTLSRFAPERSIFSRTQPLKSGVIFGFDFLHSFQESIPRWIIAK